jgi:hypothetical protein
MAIDDVEWQAHPALVFARQAQDRAVELRRRAELAAHRSLRLGSDARAARQRLEVGRHHQPH